MTELETPDREDLSWPMFGGAMRDLASQIIAAEEPFDVIVAIARGGLLPAGALAYALGLKSCGSINVEFYTDVNQTLNTPQVLPPNLDFPSLQFKRILLVDDVADTGETMKLAVELFAEHGCEATTACIYAKSHSVYVPDHVWKHTDQWINFPWSWQGPVSGVKEWLGLDHEPEAH